MKIASFFLIGFMLSVTAQAQRDVNDTSMSIPMFHASYALQFPSGDMADRFGTNSNIGGGFTWKFRNNWLLGTGFGFLFGNNLKHPEKIMSNLKTRNGNIIDLSGGFATWDLSERGYFISANAGKLFPVLSPNPNSGFLFMFKAGYFQHKIRIQVVQNTVPQLYNDYKKGYDRLTGGFGIGEFIGYQYLSNNRLINFFAGIELNQAWSKPLRDVNFDIRQPDEVQKRFDLLNGFRVGWIIPIFERLPEKEYYY